MSTPTARDTFSDAGEHLDLFQIQSPGGSIISGQTWNGQWFGQAMAQDNVTATAGGGQANGVPITGPMIRVTIVASAADSITLPPAIRGMEVVVVNDAVSNDLACFPAPGEKINSSSANASLTVTHGAAPTIFYSFSNGLWRTK